MASIKIKNPAYTEGGIEPKWLTIPMYAKMNPFEVLNITLMSNVPAPDRSMYGADITVVTADGVKILDTDWYGQPITLNIDEGVTYTVTVSVSDCYTAQEEQSFTFTAASNNIRNLNIHYKANGIKVNMLTTTGASINKPAIITYMSGDNEESVEVFHGEIAALPLGVEATITFPQVDGFDIPEPYTFTVTKDTVEYTATYSITGITKIRINHNISDPNTMIELIESTGGIEKIRANSHLYTGEVVDGVMQLKQLDDNDGTKWANGTIATINVPGIDVWMKLPQFWFKVEEYYTDIYDISFSINKVDDTWQEWDGKDLIGAYIYSIVDNKMYSYSHGTSHTYRQGISIDNAKAYAANRGEGFRITQYKHHCIMQYLFFALYKNTGAEYNYNYDGYIDIQGSMSTYVQNRIVNMNNYKVNSASDIWGLGDWINPQSEYIGNVVIQDDKMIVTNDDNSITEIPYILGITYLKKLKPTEKLLSEPYAFGASDSTYYCARMCFEHNEAYISRGSYMNDSYGNSSEFNSIVIYTSLSALMSSRGSNIDRYSSTSSDGTVSYANCYYSARLTYRGDWVIID